jgi:uncharacterized protein YdcH (DUF465 family)
MAFTVTDAQDLVRLLAEHPEWRAQVRALVLSEELLEAPARIAAIDERIAELEARMMERFAQVDERITRVEERISQVDERITRVEERIIELEARMLEGFARVDAQIAALAATVAQLGQQVNRLDDRVGNLDGGVLEGRFARHARDWLTLYVKRPVVIGISDLDRLLEARSRGRISEADWGRLIDTDLLAGGEAMDGSGEVILAGEVAGVIHPDDIARALRSVELLMAHGYRAQAMVGGHEMDEDAQSLADGLGVIVDLRRRP